MKRYFTTTPVPPDCPDCGRRMQWTQPKTRPPHPYCAACIKQASITIAFGTSWIDVAGPTSRFVDARTGKKGATRL